jgi:hypothetical protein
MLRRAGGAKYPRAKVVVLILALAVGALYGWWIWVVSSSPEDNIHPVDVALYPLLYYRIGRLSPGTQESEVWHILGAPTEVHEASSPGVDYRVPGWEVPDRRPTHKVLVYFPCPDRIVYVYIDERERVEYVFAGGS